jgi:hypothetical protein
MSEVVVHLGPWTVTRETERIPVMSDLPSADKEWRFIDAAGHGHFWRDGYPTLRTVEADCYCDAVHEDHTISHFECPHCAEVIEPGTIPPSPFPTYINGLTHVTLTYDDGRERREYVLISEADAAALLDDPVSAIPRITAEQGPISVEWRR